MNSYQTVHHYGMAEIVVQKSRFLCHAKPVATSEEAQLFIADISREHRNASHNCYAYVIDLMTQKFSDDGEPSGTAGRPILEMLHNQKCLYTAVVITRYFGGVKLGTGGLIRAYTQGAKEAIASAKVVKKIRCQMIHLRFDYTHLGKLEHELHKYHYLFEAPQFTHQINWSFWVPVPDVAFICQQITNWIHGQIQISYGQIDFHIFPEKNL